ncbi:MAG TPA: glycosyl hydrolase [Verrucomicrobiota bacterium]|nr:glycosyl hydrolase [Verrucomicrobiota bacterium]HNU53075.1 glycosyl hydrolase [Verrucomicrobiota bacterium]
MRTVPLLLASLALLACRLTASDSTVVKRLFADPPREYSTGPLWVWNDRLTEAQVRDTLRDLAGQRVRQVFVHPRPGLMTPYLDEDWFRLWKVALAEAETLDMNVWIYDENSYPSGFAGGWVPELMPESRGRGLHLRESSTPPTWTEATLAVYRADGTQAEPVTDSVRTGQSLPPGRYWAATVQRAGNSPWHGNRCYVDLLYPGVTEKFIEVTLEAYKKEVGSQFGRRIPGVFTDEPNIRPVGGFPWTDDLPRQFQRRWGYDLLAHLPSLHYEIGDWRKIRHNYHQLLLDLFIECWAKPYYQWCEHNQLEFTGHYWDHEWPHCSGVPDNMAMAAWQQRPGVDTLMNQYAEHTHAQFGNVRFCREISSVANQLGRRRTLVELYGAGGWDLRLEDMKRIGDWLEVLGINTLNEHLSYITLRGARKRDHPQSFSYHEPWWDAYHIPAQYFTRVSAALSQGDQRNRILVLEPTTTAWMYQGNEPRLQAVGNAFFRLLMALESAQVEYDLGCEDLIARFGSVADGELRIGQRQYHTLVLPPLVENLNAPTRALLDEATCRKLGLCPTRIDGSGDVPPPSTADVDTAIARLAIELAGLGNEDGFVLDRAPGDKGILFHHRRHLEDGQLLFLVNTSIEHRSSGSVRSPLGGVETWDPATGRTQPAVFDRTRKGLSMDFDLPPSGSLLAFLSKEPRTPAPAPRPERQRLTPAAGTEIVRLEPNVLVLDYLDLATRGETHTNLYFYQAQQLAFQKNGMNRNPWDSAVQFKDELIAKTFPPDSGFTATYTFTIEGGVPDDLTLVVERPDLYTIRCNDQVVRPRRGAWWLDKAFGKIPIATAARGGVNRITLEASPFTIEHELEPAYVLGHFVLQSADRGFAITPDRPLRVTGSADGSAWNRLGHPFYAHGVAYRQRYRVESRNGRLCVALPRWYGSVAEVRVNGDLAGYITAPPWELDVTDEMVTGDNAVEVTVIGTLKNLLGPHHGKPALGTAWPGMFHQGPDNGPPPGDTYHTVGYGLFEWFALVRDAAPSPRE